VAVGIDYDVVSRTTLQNILKVKPIIHFTS